MAYQYLICFDTEIEDVNTRDVKFAHTYQDAINLAQILGTKSHTTPPCIYELNSTFKLKQAAQFQQYICKNGEILPI